MKKIILLSALIAVGLASCTKKYVTNEINTSAKGMVYSIMPEDWGSDGDTVLFASLNVPELTDAVLDHGAVLVYLSFSDGTYEALPEVFDLISYTFLHYKGGVDIEMRDIDNYPIAPPNVEVWAKVILIDADKLAMHPDVNLRDLGEVKKAFNLN